ncbi:MAG: hypothetical protein R3181_02555 [Rubricoccaceae bacterium]|nr:hypothetical protein [Rubricoccaceae bacterium]
MNARVVRTLTATQLRQELRHPRSGRFAASRVGLTALAYGFSGLVLAASLGAAAPETVLYVAGSFGLVLAAFGVAGSYDELMGRPKDNAWLVTLPASEAEQYAARLVSIGLYVVLIAVSVSLPVGVGVAMAHGLAAGLSVAVLVTGGMVWTATAAVALLWALTLGLPFRVLRPAVATTRTLLIAALVLGYQWVGSQPEVMTAPWWPAAWLADGLAGRPTRGLALLLGSVGLLVAALAVYFPNRYFRLLHRLASGAEEADRRARERRTLLLPERLLVRAPAARAAYGFALSAFRDDRLVRGRLWPAALLPLGFVLFGWWMGGLGDLFRYGAENVLALPETRLHLSVVVILLFCGQSLVKTLQFSDHAEAAWVFDALPGARPRLLQLGAQQALQFRVLLPLHAVLTLVLLTKMPPSHALLHTGFWYASLALITRVHAVLHRRPPFARHGDRFDAGSRFMPLLVSIPEAIAVLIVQMLTFTEPRLALQAIIGLLLLNAGFARLLVHRRRPRTPTVGAAAVPAEAV